VTHLSNFDWGFVDKIWRLVKIRQIGGTLFLLFEGKGIKF
jgi:hypothetical protein